jgi:MoaA/NifB/PqqE/SkfB family radical SAM enzyme
VRLKAAFYTLLEIESFVKPELFDIFKKFDDCYFQVFTNGTLITDKMCQMLVEAGNVVPQISVEGYQARTDTRRGQGVCARVMTAMDRLNAHGVLFGFSTCVPSQNVEVVFSDEFIDLMIDKGAVFG